MPKLIAADIAAQHVQTMEWEEDRHFHPTSEQMERLTAAVTEMLNAGWEPNEEDWGLLGTTWFPAVANEKFKLIPGYSELKKTLNDIYWNAD